MKIPALAFSVLLASAAIAQDVDLDRADPRLRVRDLVRTVSIADGQLVVISRSRVDEPHAMVGRLVENGETTYEFRAADLLPRGFVQKGTAGQVFGAAMLDDGSLALAIGWTNQAGRNINGIAVVERWSQSWRARRVIVLRGSVRDLAGVSGGIAAVTTDVDRRGQGTLAVLLFGVDGAIRDTLFRRTASVDEVEAAAFEITLQRATSNSVAVFDRAGEVMRVYAIDPAASCAHAVESRGQSLFVYPRYGNANCDRVTLQRLLSLQGEGAVDAVRLNANGTLSVLRQGTALDRGGKPQKLDAPLIAQSVVLRDDAIEGVAQAPGGPRLLRVPLR